MTNITDGLTEEQAVEVLKIMFENQMAGYKSLLEGQPDYILRMHRDHLAKALLMIETEIHSKHPNEISPENDRSVSKGLCKHCGEDPDPFKSDGHLWLAGEPTCCDATWVEWRSKISPENDRSVSKVLSKEEQALKILVKSGFISEKTAERICYP